MSYFVWQDVIALFGTFVGASQTARIPPGFPISSYFARFVNGFLICVTVAIFGAFARSNVHFMDGVPWVQNILDFYLPLFAYALIVLLGMALLVNSALQTVLITLQYHKMRFNLVCTIMVSIYVVILIHMLSLL